MSLLAVQGGATGTGTVTLLAPVTNTDRTITLPDATGTVLTTATAGVPVNGPAFSAYGSANQTLANSTAVKIQFNTEEFDTNSCFDSTTNYRFTPTVAGYYLFNSTIFFPVSATGISVIYLYKNGSSIKLGVLNNSANGNSFPSLSALVYANGTTDYFEIYGLQTSGASQSAGSSEATRPFSAVLVRSAV